MLKARTIGFLNSPLTEVFLCKASADLTVFSLMVSESLVERETGF